jgi:acyl carrier protein
VTRAEVLELVRRVLAAEFEIDADEIGEATHLVDDLDLDSVDAVALAVRLEEETDLALEEEALKALRTVGDVVGAIHGRLGR